MKNGESGAQAKKILIVEDEPSISQVCSRTLAAEGFEVDIAANGSLAQDMLGEKDDYDLILADIRTPVMNGKQLYHSITEKHPHLAGKVVFATGDMLDGDTKDFLKQSGRLYLPKPFTPNELKAIVRKALGKV